MKQKNLLILLAFLVLIIPLIGIPESWKVLFLAIIAAVIAYVAYAEEIKAFFAPKIHHDNMASEAFSRQMPIENNYPSENA